MDQVPDQGLATSQHIEADVAIAMGNLPAKERRRALGIYYTPPEAATLLARWAIREADETVLEPSFGGCAMLSAAVKVFSDLGNQTPSKQLFGYDVDDAAFAHLAEMGIDNIKGHFQKLDFLKSTPGVMRVTTVLANPPYVSYHRQTPSQRALGNALRKRYMPELPKLASLWAYFLLHSMSFLKHHGRMAFVLPNAIAHADYAGPVLVFLRRHFKHVELIHVTERIFIQAGTDERICLLLLTDYLPEGINPLGEFTEYDIRTLAELTLVPGQLRRNDGKLSAIDIKRNAIKEIASRAGSVFQKLEDIATVQIGEVVGDIKFFVQPKVYWEDLGISIKYLYPLLTRATQVSGIDVDLKHSPEIPYLLIPPSKKVPKAIASFLDSYPVKARDKNKTFKKRETWYRCSYDNEASAFIGSITHAYPRVIGNRFSISCSNSFYKISVADESNRNFVKWLPLIALSTPFRLAAETLARVRGSGGIKLEPSDVRKLPIPLELPQLTARQLKGLQKKCNELVLNNEIEAATALVDSEIYLKPKKIDAKLLSELRKMRMALTSFRLHK